MSTKTVDILELAELMHLRQAKPFSTTAKPHPLYRKGFKNGGGRSSKLLWFQDDIDDYFESKREEIRNSEAELSSADQ